MLLFNNCKKKKFGLMLEFQLFLFVVVEMWRFTATTTTSSSSSTTTTRRRRRFGWLVKLTLLFVLLGQNVRRLRRRLC